MIRFLIEQLRFDALTTWLFLGAGLFTVAGFAVRNMLALRALIIVASALSLTANVLTRQPLLWLGNLALICLNTFQVVRLVLDSKPIALPEELKALYRQRFSAMTTREFHNWLRMGERRRILGERLCQHGALPDLLYLIIAGTVEVRYAGEAVAAMGPGEFVGEMSFLSGKAYSADVVAVGAVEVVTWSQIQIARLHTARPAFYIKVLAALGNDVIQKLQQERRSGRGDPDATVPGVGAVGFRPGQLL